jgi:hypothetical protein
MMRLSRRLLYALTKDVDLAAQALEAADRQFANIAFDSGGNYRENIGWRVQNLRDVMADSNARDWWALNGDGKDRLPTQRKDRC